MYFSASLFECHTIDEKNRFPQSIEEVGYRETAGISVASKFILFHLSHTLDFFLARIF
jgi:hypothetical protein